MKKAVILFNLGGPDKLENVEPFLFNLFNDPAILNLPSVFRFPLAKLIANRRTPTAKRFIKN
jgi:ferrochelatase